jgi:hypothetical protein
LEPAFSECMFLETNSLDYSPDWDPINCHWVYPCRTKGDSTNIVFLDIIHVLTLRSYSKVIDLCSTKWGTDIMPSWFGLLLTGYPTCPLPFTNTDSRAPHHLLQLDPLPSPQFPTEDTSSWPVSSAGQTVVLLDGQLFTPIKMYHSILHS